MKRILQVVNTRFIVDASEKVIDFVINNIPPIRDNEILNTYSIKYLDDANEYNLVRKNLHNGIIVDFYAEEKKIKYSIGNRIVLVDDNSIIIKDNNDFTIIGKNDFAQRIIIYFIREAVYENYILNKNLVFHSAAFELNNKGYSLIGQSGAGKTTLLLEFIKKLGANYIANDILAINDRSELIASILPLRIANGSLNRFRVHQLDDQKRKSKYEISDFLDLFSCNIKSNVVLDKILLPHFGETSNMNISYVTKDVAFRILKSQTMNIYDPIRPYMWVNEINRNDILKEYNIDEIIWELVNSHDVFSIEYGKIVASTEEEKLKRLLI